MHAPKSKTFTGWIALLVFSSVAIGALVDEQRTAKDFSWGWNGFSSKTKWVLACLSTSIIISALMCLVHMIGQAKPAGDRLLGGFMLVWWCAGIATIMSTSNGYAVGLMTDEISGKQLPQIINANLYFFSWGAFIAVIAIVGDSGRAMINSSVGNEPKVVKWLMLLAASVVVLASSADIMIARGCRKDHEPFCIRTKYALSLGCVASFFSLIAVAISQAGKMALPLELGLSFLNFAMYCAGVAVITGSNGPGQTMGNMYFSSWVGFLVSLFLGAACMHGVLPKNKEESSTPRETPPEQAPESGEA